MPTYHVSEASAALRVLAKGMGEAAQRGLLAAALRAVAHIQNEVIPALEPSPVARGTYRAGWRAERTAKGATIVNDVPHAVFIEEGVRGQNVKIGRAMIDALAAWVRMKGIGGRMVTSKSGTQRLKRATEDEARAIAWAIAKSMQQRGIFGGGKGLGVLKKVRPLIPKWVEEEVLREIAKEGRSW